MLMGGTWETCACENRGVPAPLHRLTEAQIERRDVRREALGRALAAARQAAGLTQDQLAQASGLSRPTISRLEQGTSSISSDRLWDLASTLGTTPSELFVRAEADDAVTALDQQR